MPFTILCSRPRNCLRIDATLSAVLPDAHGHSWKMEECVVKVIAAKTWARIYNPSSTIRLHTIAPRSAIAKPSALGHQPRPLVTILLVRALVPRCSQQQTLGHTFGGSLVLVKLLQTLAESGEGNLVLLSPLFAQVRRQRFSARTGVRCDLHRRSPHKRHGAQVIPPCINIAIARRGVASPTTAGEPAAMNILVGKHGATVKTRTRRQP
jgi:hypothetical protein